MGYSKYSHGVLTLQHDLAAMRIAELKQLCLAHGLKRTGVKVFQVLQVLTQGTVGAHRE